jgi:hypothetical protein
MVSNLVTEDIAMVEEHDVEMETSAAEEHSKAKEVEAPEDGGEANKTPIEVL